MFCSADISTDLVGVEKSRGRKKENYPKEKRLGLKSVSNYNGQPCTLIVKKYKEFYHHWDIS